MLRTLAATITTSLVLAASGALAQDLTPTAPPQSHPIVLVGGTVHTVSGETIADGLVCFDNGVITVVGPREATLASTTFAADAEFIDVTGQHVYPGLFAAESQLGLTEISAVRAMRDMDEVGDITPEVHAAVAVNPDSTLIPVTRSAGVLLFGSLPTGGRIPGRASVMRADGWTHEDMTVRADAGLVVNWPRVRAGFNPFDEEDSEQAERVVEELRKLDDLFTLAEAYRDAPQPRPVDLRLESLLPYLPHTGAHDGTFAEQLPLLIWANDYDQIVSAVTWCASRGLRCVIMGGRDAPLAADLLRAQNVPVVIEGTHTFPKRSDSPHDDPFTLPKRLADAGVTFALSTSEEDGHTRNFPQEAARAVAFGLPRDAALRAITLSPAEILGVADRYGSIEPRKSATLFVSTGDCLEITSWPTLAFIDGKRIDLTNKQTKLRDLYREKYRQLGLIKPAD